MLAWQYTYMEIELLDRDAADFRCGINDVYRAHVQGLGIGYIKVDQSEYDYPLFTPYELGAYKVSQVLGFNNVPLTVALEHPTFGPCVFSAEVKGGPKKLFLSDYYTPIDPAPYDIIDMQKIACLDIICGNTDRNGNNYRTADDGKPMGIDHGLAFGARESGSSRFVYWFQQTDNVMIDQSVLDMIDRANLDMIETELLKVGLRHEQIDLVVQRMLTMLDDCTIDWEGYGLSSW